MAAETPILALAPTLPVPLTTLPSFQERGRHCEPGLQEDTDKGTSHGGLQGVHKGQPQCFGEWWTLGELLGEGTGVRGEQRRAGRGEVCCSSAALPRSQSAEDARGLAPKLAVEALPCSAPLMPGANGSL